MSEPSGADLHCPRTFGIRGLLAALAPTVLLFSPDATFLFGASLPAWAPAAVLGALFAISAVSSRKQFAWPRYLASVSIAVLTGLLLHGASARPHHGFLILLAAVWSFAYLWPAERLRARREKSFEQAAKTELQMLASIAAVSGAALWINGVPTDVHRVVGAVGVLAISPISWLLRGPEKSRGQSSLLLVGLLLALGPVAALWPQTSALAGPLALLSTLPAFVVGRAVWSAQAEQAFDLQTSALDFVISHPPRALVVSFAGICTAGTLLLALPISSNLPNGTPWIDAAFTSVSATCVTGLTVLDTPVAFSVFGQAMILLLIQVGGLGIMLFSSAAIVLLGKRLSLKHEATAVEMAGAESRFDLGGALKRTFAVTFSVEAVSATVLSVLFVSEGQSFPHAIWNGIFTAISAFCNAGFALQSDNLVGFDDNPWILITVGMTIILGGLGPAVVIALPSLFSRRAISLHAKIALTTTAVLLIVPTFAIALFEWQQSLAHLGAGDRVVNAFFQSVTTRTAGFNSIDLTHLHPATWTFFVVLMFIGGSPGSTAGGAKTTTIALIFAACVAVLRGRNSVEAFGRTIPNQTVLRAAAIAAVGLGGTLVALLILQATQQLSLEVAVFEVISAMATVGLTIGGTAQLDEVGKIVIMSCMFAGRVGPLTLFALVALRAPPQHVRFPEEQVAVG